MPSDADDLVMTTAAIAQGIGYDARAVAEGRMSEAVFAQRWSRKLVHAEREVVETVLISLVLSTALIQAKLLYAMPGVHSIINMANGHLHGSDPS